VFTMATQVPCLSVRMARTNSSAAEAAFAIASLGNAGSARNPAWNRHRRRSSPGCRRRRTAFVWLRQL
jgi:hypothetical protein